MVSYPWARIHDWSNVSIEDFPLLSAWIDRCEARPGVKAGLKVPTQGMLPFYLATFCLQVAEEEFRLLRHLLRGRLPCLFSRFQLTNLYADSNPL